MQNSTITFETRLHSLRRMLRRYGCSHMLVSDPADVRYISGFSASHAYLLISRQTNRLFTDFRYQTAAERFCRANDRWKLGIINESGFSFLVPHVRKKSVLGVQSDRLTLDAAQRIRRQCPHITIQRISGEVSRIGTQKSGYELRMMRRASRIADAALALVRKELRPGMTERQAACRLDSLCSRMGSEGPSFPTVVLFGVRSALPHGIPTSNTLKSGDLVLCDFGCTVHGFASDMTRTWVCGTPDARRKEMLQVVYRAQQRARRSVRAGMRACDIDAVARSYISSRGYGDAFQHATGHGVGLHVHEMPRISRTNEEPVAAHTVITVEPGIYLPEVGGVRIEDMVRVRTQAPECITHAPRQW
jgi:Xaa-Pro aminopeptidase